MLQGCTVCMTTYKRAYHTKILLYTAPWKKRVPWSAVGALGGTSGRLRVSQLCTSAMSNLPANTAKCQVGLSKTTDHPISDIRKP